MDPNETNVTNEDRIFDENLLNEELSDEKEE